MLCGFKSFYGIIRRFIGMPDFERFLVSCFIFLLLKKPLFKPFVACVSFYGHQVEHHYVEHSGTPCLKPYVYYHTLQDFSTLGDPTALSSAESATIVAQIRSYGCKTNT